MSRPLVTAWFADLDQSSPEYDKQKQRREDAIRNSTVALGRLRDMLLKGSRYTDLKWNSEKFIEAPDFATKMAYELGKRAYAQHTLKLLSFLDPKE